MDKVTTEGNNVENQLLQQFSYEYQFFQRFNEDFFRFPIERTRYQHFNFNLN